MTRALVAAAALLHAGSSLAAGFDCAKAATAVEKMVCADAELSAQDERLAAFHARVRAVDASATAVQRDWLANTRDRCKDSACLKAAYASRIAALQAALPPCPVAERALAGGGWVVAEGSDYFEEFDLSLVDGQRVFASFLHHRPEMAGKWALRDCTLALDGDAEGMKFEYPVIGLDHGRLQLLGENGRRVVYRRVGNASQ